MINLQLWCLKGCLLPKFEKHNDVHDDEEKHRECKGGDEEADMKGFEAAVLLVITTVGIWN